MNRLLWPSAGVRQFTACAPPALPWDPAYIRVMQELSLKQESGALPLQEDAGQCEQLEGLRESEVVRIDIEFGLQNLIP